MTCNLVVFYIDSLARSHRKEGLKRERKDSRRKRQSQKVKGSGQSINSTARKMSTIVYMMLKNRALFDNFKMVPDKKYMEMQAVAWNAVNAV
jgi:hypothetical protein